MPNGVVDCTTDEWMHVNQRSWKWTSDRKVLCASILWSLYHMKPSDVVVAG